MLGLLRIGTACVWLLFGLVFKVLGFLPRHREIVAAILGDAYAVQITVVIGIGETMLALWILSRIYPRTCAAAQTLAIIGMNALELTLAKDHLLAPVLMVCANAVFLTAVWICALNAEPPRIRTRA